MRGKPVSHLSIFPGFRITPAYAGKTPVADTRRGGHGDHPRVCGENSQCSPMSPITLGSPPRMRGKPISGAALNPLLRITPAYAGKTHNVAKFVGRGKDHPRVCGENFDRNEYKKIYNRITPAYAGKTELAMEDGKKGEDHPRVCGENSVALWAWRGLAGSPPRMRGKRRETCHSLHVLGITPAYAGKTSSKRQICVIAGDHPRVCGENQYKLPQASSL